MFLQSTPVLSRAQRIARGHIVSFLADLDRKFPFPRDEGIYGEDVGVPEWADESRITIAAHEAKVNARLAEIIVDKRPEYHRLVVNEKGQRWTPSEAARRLGVSYDAVYMAAKHQSRMKGGHRFRFEDQAWKPERQRRRVRVYTGNAVASSDGERWESVADCAVALSCTTSNVRHSILYHRPCMGRTLTYAPAPGGKGAA